MAVVRPKERCVVRDPSGSGMFVGLDPAEGYDPADPLVKAYPNHFEADTAEKKSSRGKVKESVNVEQASAEPGEKRSLGRTR